MVRSIFSFRWILFYTNRTPHLDKGEWAMVDMKSLKSRMHLYSMPSFWKGVARLVDPLGLINTYNRSATPNEADYYALLSDWLAVGDDLNRAIELYDESLKQET